MFSYDGSVLADTVWAEYLELKKENLHLKAQLQTAAKTVEALKEKLDTNGPSIEDKFEGESFKLAEDTSSK